MIRILASDNDRKWVWGYHHSCKSKGFVLYRKRISHMTYIPKCDLEVFTGSLRKDGFTRTYYNLPNGE